MLEARSISFSYGDRSLYEGFNFAVSPGERVALSAPSGFGKTTLCRILSGYAKPSSGQVLADGAPLPKRGACPVQMIWQHPETAVDPRMRMRKVLAETAGSCPKSMGGLLPPGWRSVRTGASDGGLRHQAPVAGPLSA